MLYAITKHRTYNSNVRLTKKKEKFLLFIIIGICLSLSIINHEYPIDTLVQFVPFISRIQVSCPPIVIFLFTAPGLYPSNGSKTNINMHSRNIVDTIIVINHVVIQIVRLSRIVKTV